MTVLADHEVHDLLVYHLFDKYMFDAEFKQSYQSDTVKKMQLLQSLSRDCHPYKKFLWGKLVILCVVVYIRQNNWKAVDEKISTFDQTGNEETLKNIPKEKVRDIIIW